MLKSSAVLRPLVRSTRRAIVPLPLAARPSPLSRTLLLRPFTSSSFLQNSSSSLPPPKASPEASTSTSADGTTVTGTKVPIGQIDRRLQITFTCTAQVPLSFSSGDHKTVPGTETAVQEGEEARNCGHRSTHEFSRRSYEKGIVLVECPGCGNRHLIADNLSWFSQTPSPAHPNGQEFGKESRRTVEDLMREKGEQVKWLDGGLQGGTWELEG
ncbi:zinc finger, Zim17-type [Pseudohyphozyma bogoriensis]|nr:zinc finger, Zim17-type [Pseudohyphozyma bogoriensis]